MVHRCLHGVSEGAGDCEAVACGVSCMQTASYTTAARSVNDMAYSARSVQGVSTGGGATSPREATPQRRLEHPDPGRPWETDQWLPSQSTSSQSSHNLPRLRSTALGNQSWARINHPTGLADQVCAEPRRAQKQL